MRLVSLFSSPLKLVLDSFVLEDELLYFQCLLDVHDNKKKTKKTAEYDCGQLHALSCISFFFL